MIKDRTHTHIHSVCWYQVYEEVADLLQQDHHPAGFTVELRPDPHQKHLLQHRRHVFPQLPIRGREGGVNESTSE